MRKIFLFILFLITACSSSDDYQTEILNYTYDQNEIDLIDLTNQYRSTESLGMLIPVEHIGALCEKNNQQMIIKGPGHYNFQGAINNLNSLGYTRVSEIIGYNYISNQGFINALVDNDECLEILRGDFNYIGVSVRVSDTGKKYYTLILAKK